MKWFTNCNTLDELKATYKKLAMQYHPDLGGDTKIMQEINNLYEELFNKIKAGLNSNTSEISSDFIQIINRLSKLPEIQLELCGSWLWIDGNTKAVKEELKAAGCFWASKKSKWYWRPADYERKGKHTNTSMDKIREKYGSKIIGQSKTDKYMIR